MPLVRVSNGGTFELPVAAIFRIHIPGSTNLVKAYGGYFTGSTSSGSVTVSKDCNVLIYGHNSDGSGYTINYRFRSAGSTISLFPYNNSGTRYFVCLAFTV